MSIILKTEIKRSGKTAQLEGMFDMSESKYSTVELPDFPKNELMEKDWSIGLIVGPSGAGKTQTAKQVFSEHWPEPYEWDDMRAVVDDMPDGLGVTEIVDVMSSVGFGSPPAWLRPYRLLSNGEKFRVEVARAIMEDKPVTVIDEFTSVVDRNVAQVTSHAVQKSVRRRKQKLVAVTCHYDIEDWLQPDWKYEPANGLFSWRSVQPRPKIEIEIARGNVKDWPLFSRHHYLDAHIHKAARCLVAFHDGQMVAFCGALPQPSGTMKNAYRISRVVTLPDYQGCGVGLAIFNAMAGALKACGKTVIATMSHRGLMAALNKSPDWMITRKPSRAGRHHGEMKHSVSSNDRNTAGVRYVGPAKQEFKPLLVGGKLQ